MSRNQFAALVATIVIGFAALIVVGWISDRTTQESNRKAIERVEADLKSANRNLVAVHNSITEVEDVVRIQARWDTRNTSQITEAISDAGAAIEGEVSEVSDSVEIIPGAVERAVRTQTRDLQTEIKRIAQEIDDLREQGDYEPALICQDLREYHELEAEELTKYKTMAEHNVTQLRVSALSLASILLNCRTVLYP